MFLGVVLIARDMSSPHGLSACTMTLERWSQSALAHLDRNAATLIVHPLRKELTRS